VVWVGEKEKIVPPAGPSLPTIVAVSRLNEALYLDAPPTAFGMAMIGFGVKAAAEK
jgi:hypothetical protein